MPNIAATMGQNPSFSVPFSYLNPLYTEFTWAILIPLINSIAERRVK